ncbi:MAG: alpha-ketoacid dehydrogenase subunit beta [Chlamydiae bacterium CG10_big_fil_rev_8_21_14_0_10_35_9]|nr:MAG: alpha-ketoacid dehydrogenase subunit beta [Chlamydiae bacterium CG10_big_fil_rev_8_21_14_0_10_35_9]
MPKREIKFSQAILEAQDQLMTLDPNVYIIGLGAPDPKGLFGTTLGLQEKHGKDRVLDMPISENAMTGIVTGSAIMGLRPIMTHQRVDFFLLGLDQLINNSAKWHYMFGGQNNVPIVFRLFMGRGWGQGPQHSQSLQSIFSHIPGLKVVTPSTCYNAKGLLISAIEDNNPVVFLEHRWLHSVHGEVPEKVYRVPLGKANLVSKGNDITIVSNSHMTLESWKAIKLLEKENISIELIDLQTLIPLDKETILQSVKKTGHVIVVDPDWKTCGFSSEVLSVITEEAFDYLKKPPIRVTYPDHPCPTSWVLSNHYYPTSKDIALTVLKMMNKKTHLNSLTKDLLEQKAQGPLDIPDSSFTGPF